MPGAEWFPGTQLNYAEHDLPRQARRRASPIVHASELRALDTLDLGPAARRDRADPRRAASRAASAAATASPPTCRTSPRRWPRSSRRRRSARCGRAPRRSSARAAWSTASRRSSRRCCWRSTATATAARTSTAARWSRRSREEIGAPVVRLGYLDGSGWEDGFLGRRRALDFEPVPFDHPLWVLYSSGTTGLPKAIVQGHGGILLEQLKKMHLHLDAQRGRPRVLVHHDRLDDVELPRRRAAHRRPRSCSTTATRARRTSTALGPRRGGGDDDLRDERELHRDAA